MKKTKKLNLNDLKVESFLTEKLSAKNVMTGVLPSFAPHKCDPTEFGTWIECTFFKICTSLQC